MAISFFFNITPLFAMGSILWSEITKVTIQWNLPILQLNKTGTEEAHFNIRTSLQHIFARLSMKKANDL